MDELVPLTAASAQAYLALGDAGRAPLADGVLDVVAIALSACIPIYGGHGDALPLRVLSDGEMRGGRFIQGAAVLHFPSGGPAFTHLAVNSGDLAAAIARLKKAGVNFSQARFEHAPRRIPRIAPA